MPNCRSQLAIFTNIGSLNHADVVAAVADAAHCLLRKLSNEVRDVGFLRRRASACDDHGQLRCQNDEFGAKLVQAELRSANLPPTETSLVRSHLQRLSVDDQTTIQLGVQEVQHVPHLIRGFHCHQHNPAHNDRDSRFATW